MHHREWESIPIQRIADVQLLYVADTHSHLLETWIGRAAFVFNLVMSIVEDWTWSGGRRLRLTRKVQSPCEVFSFRFDSHKTVPKRQTLFTHFLFQTTLGDLRLCSEHLAVYFDQRAPSPCYV